MISNYAVNTNNQINNTQELSIEEKKVQKKTYYQANKEKALARQKAYYEANREKALLRQKAYHQANKEKINSKRKEYDCVNKERTKARRKKYSESNKQKIKEQRKLHYERNKEKIKAEAALWIKNNKERKKNNDKAWQQANRQKVIKQNEASKKVRIATDLLSAVKNKLRNAISNAFRRIKQNKPTNTQSLLGCTWEEAKVHLESLFEEGMTWENHGVHGWHIDHIRPLASFNLDEIHLANHISNFQPLWAVDNLAKKDRLFFDI